VAIIFVTLIVTAIVLAFTFANIQLFPSTLNMTEENMAITTKENMIGDNDNDNKSEDNATEMNESGKISAFYDECPLSFC
jgi:hypothetical protein